MENLKENYDINYGYTTILAFIMNLRFNRSRKIELSVLKEYPKIFLRKLRNHEKDNYNITMFMDDNELKVFLEANEELFTIDNNYVYLNENVPVNTLYIFLNAFNYPFTPSSIYLCKYDYELKDKLKLSGLRQILENIYKMEEIIKRLYLLIAYNQNDKHTIDKINETLQMRNNNYSKILNGSRTFMDDLYSEAYTFDKINPFIFYYPIDEEIDFGEYINGSYNSYDEVLNDPYFYCIFASHTNPARYRMYYDFSGLNFKFSYNNESDSEKEFRKNVMKTIMKERSETGDCIYTARFRTSSLFFLKFIMCLDEIQNKYGKNEELELTKYKLIYLLDNIDINLLEDNNIEKVYNKLLTKYQHEKDLDENYIEEHYSENDIINTDPFEMEWYQVLIKAFVVDLFKSGLYDKELEYKKLAFVKAYYSITKDEEIIKLFNNFSDHPKFWEYYSFVKGNNLILKRKKEE